MNINPIQYVEQAMKRNPQLANNQIMQNTMNMYKEGNVSGLQNLAENICKTKGIDMNNLISMFRK